MFNIEFCFQSLDSCNILQGLIEMNDAGQLVEFYEKDLLIKIMQTFIKIL